MPSRTEILYRQDFPVQLVGYDGDDSRVVLAARVSTNSEDKTRNQKRLIKYLIRHGHWSPFEHVTFTFRSEMPIFIARQVMRHKSQAFNEMSLRYSEALPHFFLPEKFYLQSGTMKQGRAETPLGARESAYLRENLKGTYEVSWRLYETMINWGVSREEARSHLPVSTYTALYTTANLRSLIHFLGDREERGAQIEIQQYAANVRDAVKDIIPVTLEVLDELKEERRG